MKNIPDNSIDVILTDPPYLYLKNQKLDRVFDEYEFFREVKRVLKKDGFIIMFGRGASFYRWNTILANLGFTFKEEIIWNKGYSTSPLMPLTRIHETISVHTKGKGKILRSKIPYLEMKKYDLNSICADIKRMSAVLHNPKSLAAVLSFLKNNKRDTSDCWSANNLTISSPIKKEDRCVSVARGMGFGCNEKTIIRSDRVENKRFTKFSVTTDKRKSGERCANNMQSLEFGLNEKDIIKETPNRYKAIHPTEKPVRLMERLLNLVCPKSEDIIVMDPFSGSGSTALACINTGRKYIGYEIDNEYFKASEKRISNSLGMFKSL
jgi:site-specific DNA-methyltransferase (adenine-specific)